MPMGKDNVNRHKVGPQHLTWVAIACVVVTMPLSAVQALPQLSTQDSTQSRTPFDVFRAELKTSLDGAAADANKALKKLTRDIDRERKRITKREYPAASLRAQSQLKKDLAGLAEMQSAAMGVRAELGLIWLAFHQGPDGRWSANSFEDLCGLLNPGTYCTGRGSVVHDVGVSGLSLLAFVRARQSSEPGRWAETILRGRDFLLENQQSDGALAGKKANAQSYDHLVALLALVELQPDDNDPRLKPAIAAALRFARGMQQPGVGWRYVLPKSEDMLAYASDVSVTGWAIQVLVALEDAGLPADDRALSDGLNFIAEMTDADGRTGYYERGGPSSRIEGLGARWPDEDTEAMTAVAVVSRALGDSVGRSGRDPGLQDKAIAFLSASPPRFATELPDNGGVDYYYWYYGTRALAWAGGERWWNWLDALQQAAQAHGLGTDDELGSWGPAHDPWGVLGGRVYSTAIMTLTALSASHAH